MIDATVELTIDGQALSVPAGTTVLAAARQLGIDIPTLCHDPELTNPGSCRLCVVEIEVATAGGMMKMRNLPPSCVTAVSPGMVVRTGTEAVVEARRTVLELLLANHPKDCLRCERTGRCKLQTYAYEYGADFPLPGSALDGERRHDPLDDGNPFIRRDMNKCVLCGKCVRVCAEVQGRHVLDYVKRGFATTVGPAFERPLGESDCVFCGSCVALCPTGALVDKTKAGKGRPWDVRRKVRTTCPYCGTGCNFDLEVVGRPGAGEPGREEVIGVASASDGPVNGRHLCVKGRFGLSFIHHPDRLRRPLVKKEGRFVETSWEEAIALVAERFQAIRADHGGDAFGVLASAKATNEDNYLINRFARAVLGTNNIDHCARLCHASTVAGLAAAFGSGAMTNPIGDIAKSDFLLVIGSNTTESHPVLAQKLLQAIGRGTPCVVIDPRQTELAAAATNHLAIRPGGDLALLNALAHVIIAEGLSNQAFIEERTEGFAELQAAVADCTPEWAAPIAGIAPEVIRETARRYAKAERASIFYTMGITQKRTGSHNVMAIANLALLTGHIGKEGSGVNPLRGQNNVQGACDMGALPNVFPGYQPVTDPAVRAKFAGAWGVASADLAEQPGFTVGEMLEAARSGSLKAMLIVGENPVLSDPDSSHVVEALQQLECLVAVDIFLSETAQLAHVVLPACTFAEKEGTFTNTERRVQRVRQAIEPIGESRPDWRIMADLAAALGRPFDLEDPAAVMAEIARLTPSYGGVSHERIDRDGGLCWPCLSPEHPGTPRLHVDRFTRGKGRFHGVHYLPPAEATDGDYPLVLSTGRRLFHYHTGTMSRRTGLETIYPEEHLEMHPGDAAACGLVDGDWVCLSTRRGAIALPVRLTESILAGTVFTSFHFAEAAVNKLTIGVVDPVAKIPELKVCACRVERVEPPEGYRPPAGKRALV
ncbi:formate dehydrogenase subunit alpha [Heliobacterium gestii]|uniref:Formate dehydrogenase subunit alpha n=1 Tax=Heliomicrobium gestii TaxID=2699 RepID=A0A845L759_HELGE|nr:formate dehydrogenase subunit alpha [Heliomicrobium gestii]MBM7866146.1 formate dehydrogenase alpha subunit [Heliomicrobium gestii]MZP42527.1 formate dehydrogenase subunit alpha [Heliomicrobium gestii]